jgi:hypothetical protein
MNPKYPVYIISKGRADTRLTSRTLEYMNVPYTIVVEPQEYLDYAKVINSKKILVTPFSNLGQGSIPVRNFVFEHAIKSGAKKHWILDDNIKYFYRLNHNQKYPFNTGTVFKIAEEFVDRYENIGLAGFQYRYFVPSRQKKSPFQLNTRIYSCILINHRINLKWRGKYNEDTDLSLRVLKGGWCTILFNSFLCGKIATLVMKGGNTSTIYNTGDEREEFVDSLIKQHPKLVKKVRRYNRWHHEVDYSSFKQEPILKKGIKIPEGINEYGLELIKFKEPKPSINLQL